MRRKISSMSSKKDKRVIVPFFLTHGGCVDLCTFCNQELIEGVSPGTESSFIDFEKRLSSCTSLPDEIAIYGGDFLNMDRARMVQLLDDLKNMAEGKLGCFPPIRISTSPGAIEVEKLELVKGYNVRTIEIGVVSTDGEVLRSVKRGYAKEDAIGAVKCVIDRGFQTGVQFITGLPADTCERFLESLSAVLSLKPQFARLYPLVILRGTPLGKEYQMKKCIPHTREYILRTTCLFILFCLGWNVKIARIGLHDSGISEDDILFRSSFDNLRQEAEGIVLIILLEYLMSNRKDIESVKFNARFETALRGKKGENLQKILDIYPDLSGKISFHREMDGIIEMKAGTGRFSVKEGVGSFIEFGKNRIMEQKGLWEKGNRDLSA